MATHSFLETQTKLIRKELSKTKIVISNKKVLYKNANPPQNFTISGLV